MGSVSLKVVLIYTLSHSPKLEIAYKKNVKYMENKISVRKVSVSDKCLKRQKIHNEVGG